VSVLGERVLRVEDPRFLRGEGLYVENVDLPGAAYVSFVRSPVAHARVGAVDTSAARDLPGIQVFTGADVPLEPIVPPYPGIEVRMPRPLVAMDTVRFVGELVAVVVSDTRAAGLDAAELVFADYDPLPVVVDPEVAAKDELLLFPDLGTNVASRRPLPDDDPCADCEVVARGRVVSPRMIPMPIEPRSVAAKFEDGRLTVWVATQTPHQGRHTIAHTLGLDEADIRVIAPDVGGGFGAKNVGVEELLVCWLAMHLGRPCRWTESRSENMLSMAHGRAVVMDFTIGGRRDGTIDAYRIDILQDAGAYPGLGAFLPFLTAMMSTGVYRIPTVQAGYRAVATNTTPTGPFRGAGRPEAAQAIERAVDLFAAEAGLDPADVRRKNFIPPDAFPLTTPTGANYDCGDYAGALERALRAAGYDELRAKQRRRRDAQDVKQLGIGLSAYVEVTNGGPETEFGEVEVTEDGGAIVRTGSFSHGQGHETTFAMIVGARLGIPVEKIKVVKGDTDQVARGMGTYGSKSTQIGGAAAGAAAEEVAERAKRLAADGLEANPDDMVLDPARGEFHVVGAPSPSLSWAELAARLSGEARLGELTVSHDFKPADSTYPFGAHVAVVEVDTETGAVELLRHVAVDDAGTLINPLVAEGQVHGGVATGVAQALYEIGVYDDDGNLMTSSFATYGIPSAAELPSWDTVEMETPTPMNPLGAKGIGESGTIGATPAVLNAVVDALAPFGVKHVEMPANGENVWRALQSAR
jgi:carbon-monoxide dehydrogenase large subunit